MAAVQKRKIKWAISLFLVMLYFSDLTAQAQYGGGSGEPNDPYLIYTDEQMNEIGLHEEDWDKHFKLMENIDLSGYVGGARSPVFNIIGRHDWPFTGTFDGNGKKISNFTYTSRGANEIGLFGYVSGENAEIKDLGLINPNIDVDAGTGDRVGSLVGYLASGTITNCYVEGGSVSGDEYAGGLLGWNGGRITNCYSTGSSVSGSLGVGGLVGSNETGTISNSYSTGSVTGWGGVGGLAGENYGPITNCCATGNVSGDLYVGGLVGWNADPISNCYATGNVSGDLNVGGLVGWNDWAITNCYSAGSISGDLYVGGLVGYNDWAITNCYSVGSVVGNIFVGGLVGSTITREVGAVTDSFWDIQTSGQTNSDGGTGKTTAEMQMESTFIDVGWDFVAKRVNGTEDIWWILEGQEYPRLWWQLLLPLLPDQASNPEPADGALHLDMWVNLSWTTGGLAVSHDVYFSENFDDVNDGAEGTFRGNQAETFFIAGFPGFPYPDGLVPGTTYYWRIDEVNDTEPNSPWKGNVWSFSISPNAAYAPGHFAITYYDNYNYDTGQWDAWQSAATPQDAWDDKYLADGSSGNTVYTDHAFTSITAFDLRGGLFSKDGHASGGEDWNPLQSIGDNVSGQSAHHVFAALFKGLIYLEEGDVLWVASDDDVYVFLDGDTAWGQEVLSVPFISYFDTDSMTVTAAQEGYHMMTVKYIERQNVHSGIEITVNGEHFQNAEVGIPTNLGSTVNSAYWDASPDISADGLALFFDSDRPGGSGGRDLYVTTRATKDDDWGRPVNLGQPVNTPSYDGQPGISADGRALYFSSDRRGGFGNQDLWVTTRPTTDDEWGAPVNLGPTVNSPAHDTEPSISADGLTLFFDCDRPGGYGHWDIWMVTRASTDDHWRTPVPLPPPVNSAFNNSEPSISADGRALYFSSYRPSGYGTCDLWVARRETTDDEWGTPVNLGPTVNTTYHEWGASISADGSTLYFTAGGPLDPYEYDLWQVSLEVSGLEDFEMRDFSKFPWEHYGDETWAVTSREKHSGAYSAQAVSIGDDEYTTLEITLDCVSGDISFYCKVSSELGCDYLEFYIDGVKKGDWSGEEDWVEVSFPVTSSTRTFEWTYSKDGSESEGNDTAWIDDIVFPIN